MQSWSNVPDAGRNGSGNKSEHNGVLNCYSYFAIVRTFTYSGVKNVQSHNECLEIGGGIFVKNTLKIINMKRITFVKV